LSPSDIVAAARELVGTPFRHQGRIPNIALDCAGLICAVAVTLGIEHVDIQGYGRYPHENLLKLTLDDQCCLAPVKDMQIGDVLLMRFGREPQHLAIYAGETIIHSYEAVGNVCEHRLDDVWTSRIVAVYRFAAVA